MARIAPSIQQPPQVVSTGEYDTINDVVRTLSRIIAKRPQRRRDKSAEVARSLSTESHYNGETKEEKRKRRKRSRQKHKPHQPGTELLSALGASHTVNFSSCKEGKTNEEVLARDHTTFSYNEGAPSEGGPYHLVTKTVDGAEATNKEEFDKHTETSYSAGKA